MKTFKWTGSMALAIAILALGTNAPARAADGDAAKPSGVIGSFWTLPKEPGKVTLVLAGQAEPVTLNVTENTIFSGICLDCNLPFEFKPDQVGKKCMVCGCAVSNAACMVGKPVKEGTWQAMVKALPRGVALRPKFNTADKPESGISRLAVDLRTVLLPVSGLDSATPDQLLALVKPLGGSQAELIDGGKRLSVRLKSDWNFEKEAKLEKALAKLNGKVVVAEDAK